jgi:hypothetical protein
MNRHLLCFAILFSLASSCFGQSAAEEYAIFEISSNSKKQNGFKIKNETALYTSLHGLLLSVGNIGELKTLEITASGKSYVKDKENENIHKMVIDKIDVKRDLVRLVFAQDPGKKIKTSGLNYVPRTLSEVKHLCSNSPDHLVWYRFAMEDGARHNNETKGTVGNCQRSILSLIEKGGEDSIAWKHFNTLLNATLDQKIAFDFTAGKKINRGWSGAPVLWRNDRSIAGVVTLRVSEEFGVGLHFDTTGLLPISNFSDVKSNEYRRLKNFHNGVKQWNTTNFCSDGISTSIPPDELKSRYYDPCVNANGDISKKEKRKFKSGRFGKSFALAYSRHFDYSPANKSVSFNRVLSSKSFERYPETFNGATLRDVFLKVMYVEHNPNNAKKVNLDENIRLLNEHYAGIPITSHLGKKWKKADRQYKKDVRWWRKYGYDFDEEIKKYLRYYASKVACDSGMIELNTLVRSKDYCAVHLVGQQLLANYCETTQQKRDSIGLILCQNLRTVDAIADSLITCALTAVDSGKLKCASTSLLLARALMQCTDQHSYVDSIQMQLENIDSLEVFREKAKSNYSPERIFSRVNEGFHNIRQSNVGTKSLPFSLEAQGNLLDYSNEALQFTYTYGAVDPSKYYLSAFHSGFPPAEYITYESERALRQLEELLVFIEHDSILKEVFPKSGWLITIEGFADGLRYRSKFKYRNEFGSDIYGETVKFSSSVKVNSDIANEALFAHLKENKIRIGNTERDFGVATGLGKNYALSYLRATHAYKYLEKQLKLEPKNFERLANVVDATDKEGTYRRMQLTVKLNPVDGLVDKLFKEEGTCPCDKLVERYGSAIY